MKRIKGWFYLHVTEWRYCLFLKELGIYISFEKDVIPGTRRLKKHKIIEHLGLFYIIESIKCTLIKDYVFFKPLRHVTEVDYFNYVYQEFKDQIDTLISFSAAPAQKRFFQFVKALEHFQATGYQNNLTFPS